MRRAYSLLKKLFTKWLLWVPFAYLIPKKSDRIICIEQDQGAWRDNIKYFYLFLVQKNADVYYLTEDRMLYQWLRKKNLPVLFHESLRSYYFLLRAKFIILSSSSLQRKNKYYLTWRAKKVQLWHGLGIKRFELLEKKNEQYIHSLSGKIDSVIKGKFITHDLMISTSEFFVEHVFSKAVRARKYLVSGYPRNDYLLSEKRSYFEQFHLSSFLYSDIQKKKECGMKIIVYAPTFRARNNEATSGQMLDLHRLSRYAKENNLYFVFKYHGQDFKRQCREKYEHITFFDPHADIQPLLGMADMLITDYSSVYFDFLLLKRPILFYVYDFNEYMEKDRGFLFDYYDITPGPKCQTQDELFNAIDIYLRNPDWYQEAREKVTHLAHDYADSNASQRIWEYLLKMR